MALWKSHISEQPLIQIIIIQKNIHNEHFSLYVFMKGTSEKMIVRPFSILVETYLSKSTLCCGHIPRLFLISSISVLMSWLQIVANPEVGGNRPVRIDLMEKWYSVLDTVNSLIEAPGAQAILYSSYSHISKMSARKVQLGPVLQKRDLCHCNTKRKIGWDPPANSSFCMTTTKIFKDAFFRHTIQMPSLLTQWQFCLRRCALRRKLSVLHISSDSGYSQQASPSCKSGIHKSKLLLNQDSRKQHIPQYWSWTIT